MNYQIDLLKNHPQTIPALVQLWYEGLGKVWFPDIAIEKIEQCFYEHLNDNSLPLTFVALVEGIPAGMCSLRMHDVIRQDLSPWLAALVVAPQYQRQGIGKALIHAVKEKQTNLILKSFIFLPLILQCQPIMKN